MSQKSEAIADAQARSTRRKYRRNLEWMTSLTTLSVPQLKKALAESGSKAAFKDKNQAILATITATIGGDVAKRFDAKVLNPPAEDKASGNGKASKSTKSSKASKTSKAEAEEPDETWTEEEEDGDDD